MRLVFHAVVAVNSLHWVDPEVRYAKPHELLRPGCVMIVAGCLWVQPADAERFWRVCRMTTGPWPTRESCAATRADRTVISRPRPGPCSREVARLRYSPFQAATGRGLPSQPGVQSRHACPGRGPERRVPGTRPAPAGAARLARLTATFVAYLTVGSAASPEALEPVQAARKSLVSYLEDLGRGRRLSDVRYRQPLAALFR